MTPAETFICSMFEITSIFALMNIFDSQYLKKIWKVLMAAVLVAGIVTATDGLLLPWSYLLNSMSAIFALWLISKSKLADVIFQYLITFSIVLSFQMLFLYLTEKLGIFNSLSLTDRLIQLIVILTICAFIGTNKTLHLKIRPFYQKYKKSFYLIITNLIIFMMVWLYVWDSNHFALLREMGLWMIFLALWVIVNIYLMKNLIDNSRQKTMLDIHKEYMNTSEKIMDSIYKDKHEFNKHLQTILGYCNLETPEVAVKEINSYIIKLKSKNENETEIIRLNTGHGVINALLYTKLKEAEEKNINFIYLNTGVFPDFPCEKFELVEIVGNLINNAFDYVDDLEIEKRKVILRIFADGNISVIEVRNPIFDDRLIEYNRLSKSGYTTKTGNRGYGPSNVSQILKKRHGSLNIKKENDEILISALL